MRTVRTSTGFRNRRFKRPQEKDNDDYVVEASTLGCGRSDSCTWLTPGTAIDWLVVLASAAFNLRRPTTLTTAEA